MQNDKTVKIEKEEIINDKFQHLIKTYDDVQEKDVEWIWYPYIPKGKFVFIIGDPGSGKTFFATYLASIISRGALFYNSTEINEESIVLLQNGEDGKDDTIKNRLKILNAKYENILYLDESEKIITLKDIEIIKELLILKRPSMMIFDPATLYVGKKVDMNSANDVRSLLNPLVPLLEEYRCTMVLVLHMNKGANKAMYKALGSIDFMAIARSVIMITNNPNASKERLLIHVKSSLAEKGDTLAFTISDNGIEWLGVREINEDTMDEDTVFKKDQAKEFILSYLSKGNVPSDELMSAGLEKGFSQKTFENARKELRNENKITCFKRVDKYYWKQVYDYPF